jgi:hypothetical protein
MRQQARLSAPVAGADQIVEVVLPSGVAGPVKDCPGADEHCRGSADHAYPRCQCGRDRLIDGSSYRRTDLGAVLIHPDIDRIARFDWLSRLDCADVFGSGSKPSGTHRHRLARRDFRSAVIDDRPSDHPAGLGLLGVDVMP